MFALVGYTGFVGSNLLEKGDFQQFYNSKNIKEAYGTKPDLLVYAGLRAEKYLANRSPEDDMKLIFQAQDNISRIAPKKLVLISTIDVFELPVNVNEDSLIVTDNLQAYGLNRYRLECWARENFPDSLIVRLPGLYGKNIKKNFIYDFMSVIPFMLKINKFEELATKKKELYDFYTLQNNGFYRCNPLSKDEQYFLKNCFFELGFTALNFTDSRNVYQFYPLDRLWNDIKVCLSHQIHLFHPATEPVSAAEVFEYLTGKKFLNKLGESPVFYDFKTSYADLFEKKGCYIMEKLEVLKSIKSFITNFQQNF